MEEPLGGPDDAQVPAMAEGGEQEQELLIPDLPIEGGVVVANIMNPDLKKWYWLVASPVIALINQIDDSAPKHQLITPELAMFAAFLCAVCFMFRAMI